LHISTSEFKNQGAAEQIWQELTCTDFTRFHQIMQKLSKITNRVILLKSKAVLQKMQPDTSQADTFSEPLLPLDTSSFDL
jgi:hypothetical protein